MFVPDPCILGEYCILFESLDLCGFKTGKNTERSLLVTELEHFERLKPIKRVIFYCFIRKIVQLSQVNLSKIQTILFGSFSVPQQPMRVLSNRKDISQKSLVMCQIETIKKIKKTAFTCGTLSVIFRGRAADLNFHTHTPSSYDR